MRIPNPLDIQQNLLTVADEKYCEPELSYPTVFLRTMHASILMSGNRTGVATRRLTAGVGTLRTRTDRLASCPGLREKRTKASDLPSCARRRSLTPS